MQAVDRRAGVDGVELHHEEDKDVGSGGIRGKFAEVCLSGLVIDCSCLVGVVMTLYRVI